MKEQNYVDLGLPSGTLWSDSNVDDNYYTFNEAVERFDSQLPTRTQFCELIDYTEHKWDDERKGMIFTGKNGNSIFLPASGYGSDGHLYRAGSYGRYWSSTFYGDYYAWYLFFSSGNAFTLNNNRSNGFSIRLVKDNFLKK